MWSIPRKKHAKVNDFKVRLFSNDLLFIKNSSTSLLYSINNLNEFENVSLHHHENNWNHINDINIMRSSNLRK